MRLGGKHSYSKGGFLKNESSGPFTPLGSAGYNPTIKEGRYSRGRRSSDCFGMAPGAAVGGGGGLRTPPIRGRRFSDSSPFQKKPRSRKVSSLSLGLCLRYNEPEVTLLKHDMDKWFK